MLYTVVITSLLLMTTILLIASTWGILNQQIIEPWSHEIKSIDITLTWRNFFANTVPNGIIQLIKRRHMLGAIIISGI